MRTFVIVAIACCCCCPQPYGSFPPVRHNVGQGQTVRPAWMTVSTDSEVHRVCFELAGETWCGVVERAP